MSRATLSRWGKRHQVNHVTVDQARLERSANPSPNYGQAYLRLKLEGKRWPETRLLERRAYLTGLAAEMAPKIEAPPASWTGQGWLERHDELRGYEGELAAIEELLASPA